MTLSLRIVKTLVNRQHRKISRTLYFEGYLVQFKPISDCEAINRNCKANVIHSEVSVNFEIESNYRSD
ncbi:MAG: hypothetical protein ACTS4V_00035 [Candidatus Hodgkinia cicadicola]